MDITVGHVWQEGEKIRMFEGYENKSVAKLRKKYLQATF